MLCVCLLQLADEVFALDAHCLFIKLNTLCYRRASLPPNRMAEGGRFVLQQSNYAFWAHVYSVAHSGSALILQPHILTCSSCIAAVVALCFSATCRTEELEPWLMPRLRHALSAAVAVWGGARLAPG